MKAVLERNLGFMGYPYYSVDTDGNVWSHKCGKFRKMTCTEDNNGYSYVCLWNNGIQKRFIVHRIVALAFIPNPDNKPCIDHINTIRTDNRVSNLRWCTHKENNNNPISIEHYSISKKGENSPMWGKHLSEDTKRKMSDSHKGDKAYWFGKHLTEEIKNKISEGRKDKYSGENHPFWGKYGKDSAYHKAVLQYTKDGQFIAEYPTVKQAAQAVNSYGSNITNCCRGKLNSARGYIWKYKEEGN